MPEEVLEALKVICSPGWDLTQERITGWKHLSPEQLVRELLIIKLTLEYSRVKGDG